MKKRNLKVFKDFLNKNIDIRPILGRFFDFFKDKTDLKLFFNYCKVFCYKSCILVIALGIFYSLSFPQYSLAHTFPKISHLPKILDKSPVETTELYITAYNSLIWQTNYQPCITASGLNVCERDIEDIIATNYSYLSFGSKIKIPELFGDREFIVEDRMNQRYTRTLDIWMKSYTDAKEFGRKKFVVEIYSASR